MAAATPSDLADECVFLMNYYGKPDGAPRILLGTSRLKELSWQPTIALDAGITHAGECYSGNV